MKRKTLTILVAGIVALSALIVFAGDPVPGLDISIQGIPGGEVSTGNYNSSLSNKSTVAKINEDIGNLLIRFGIGGSVINQITDALEGGVYKAELRSFLIAIGIGEEGTNAIFAKLDELGAGFGFIKADDEEKEISTSDTEIMKTVDKATPKLYETLKPSSDTGDTTQGVEEIELAVEQVKRGEISTPDTGDTLAKEASYIKIEGLWEEAISALGTGDDVASRKFPGRPKYGDITLKRTIFQNIANDIIQKIRVATPEERENLVDELQANRGVWDTEIVSMDLSIRENAKGLREDFHETFKQMEVTGYCAKCKERKVLIAVAHANGLRMIYRFDSAIARFGHIIGKIESRVDKLEAQENYQIDSFFDIFTSIEEAKNMNIQSKAKLEQLKIEYESLLLGENIQGIGEEARIIAKELKVEIENLHAKLREIVDEIKNNIAINEEGLG